MLHRESERHRGFVGATLGELAGPGTGTGDPGVDTSPPYAETLRANARIVVAQVAFRVFISSPNSIFGFGIGSCSRILGRTAGAGRIIAA